ncbi:MAG TPA: hypothetical protein VF092_01710 [Longimicrobium sp.]
MPGIRLQPDDLQVESFTVRPDEDAPAGEFYNTGNDHCTGPTYVVVTCATCGEEYDTCAYTCEDSCDVCGWTGAKPICLD